MRTSDNYDDDYPSFVEAKTIEQANSVNLDIYRFERFSESKGVYIFVRRRRH